MRSTTMRVLLTAMNCEKGALSSNLGNHLQLLGTARVHGCDIAVFPEFSLTGSVDPLTHPEQAIPLDDAAVAAMVEGTLVHGVAAIFGLAERAGSALYITQVYAAAGRILGVCRKRVLGEGEEGYAVGTESEVFTLGAVSFGIVICAESPYDSVWAEAAETGAEIVFFCSAPGLYGRRTDAASWAEGYAWWEESGLGDAQRSARRHELWVGLSTQAGSTVDEDFPGLAALVSPAGEVIERLPDWKAGMLVVDIDVDLSVAPVRRAARVLVVDEEGRTLLVRFADESDRASWWAPPGGGLEDGEDHEDAARRELAEELDRVDLELGPWIGYRTHTFWWDGWMTQHERWVLCRTTAFEVAPAHVAKLRSENIRDLRWWSAADLRTAGVFTRPADLPALLDRLAAGDIPAPDSDLGA